MIYSLQILSIFFSIQRYMFLALFQTLILIPQKKYTFLSHCVFEQCNKDIKNPVTI